MPTTPHARTNPRARWVPLLSASLAAALALSFANLSSSSLAAAPTLQTSSTTRDLGRLTTELQTQFAGSRAVTRPSQDAFMGFSAPTRVTEVLIRSGLNVKKGDMILRGDDAEDQALLKIQQVRVAEPLQVEGAKAGMDLAKLEYDRLREAFAKNASGVQEVERARLGYEVRRIEYLVAQNQETQEKLQLERMSARVDKFRVRAPFDGIVDTVNADVGQVVNENEKIVRVVDIDPLWIDVNAPTDDKVTLALKAGAQAWVLCDVAGDAKLALGTVVEVAPTADPASRTRRVRVEVKNPAGDQQLIAGEPVWVRFTQPTNEALKVADKK
jgi:RND family efflux transporter MFP subunit